MHYKSDYMLSFQTSSLSSCYLLIYLSLLTFVNADIHVYSLFSHLVRKQRRYEFIFYEMLYLLKIFRRTEDKSFFCAHFLNAFCMSSRSV